MKRGAREKWTAALVADAVGMIRSGMSVAAVAETFSTSTEALGRVLFLRGYRIQDLRSDRLGGARLGWTSVDDMILRDEHARGLNDTEIGAILKRSPNGVKHRRKVLGLPGVHVGIGEHIDWTPDEPVKATMRKCLGGCERMFPSTGAGHRVCDDCVKTEPYQSPVTIHGFCA